MDKRDKQQYLKSGRVLERRPDNNSALPLPTPPPPPFPSNYFRSDFTLFPVETDRICLPFPQATGQEDTSSATNLPFTGNTPFPELLVVTSDMSTMEYENDQRGYDGEFKHALLMINTRH